MEFAECIKGRRSIRKYKDTKMAREVFEEIVGLAAYAPSWKNTQITRYTLIEDEKMIQRLADECVLGFEYNAKTLRGAPNVIIVSYITGRSGYEKDGSFSTGKGDHWEVFDTGIATQTLCLAAHGKGYGTVILGVFDEEKTGEVVGIPEGQRVAAVVPIGLPDESPAAPRRKDAGELVSYK